jgi:hypothetical protein
MSLIFLLIVAYFVIRAITRAACAPHYYYGYGQTPPPPPQGYVPGPGQGPGQQGYYGPPPGYPNSGYGGWGPGYGGGNGFMTGLVGGLGGAWLGNEMFGQHGNADPGTQIAPADQSNAIDSSGGQTALGDGGGGSW